MNGDLHPEYFHITLLCLSRVDLKIPRKSERAVSLPLMEQITQKPPNPANKSKEKLLGTLLCPYHLTNSPARYPRLPKPSAQEVARES